MYLAPDGAGFVDNQRQSGLVEAVATGAVLFHASEERASALLQRVGIVAQSIELRVASGRVCADRAAVEAQQYNRPMPLRRLGQFRAAQQIEQRHSCRAGVGNSVLTGLDVAQQTPSAPDLPFQVIVVPDCAGGGSRSAS